MPTSTYDLIASNVLTSSASSVTFSSIPATYRDLVLVTKPIPTGGDIQAHIKINADTGNNYSRVLMRGNGTTASSLTATGGFVLGAYADLTLTNTLGIFQFMDYSATDKHKTVLSRLDNSGDTTVAVATRWANTAAINTLEVYTASNSFASGSTFYLYGIVS